MTRFRFLFLVLAAAVLLAAPPVTAGEEEGKPEPKLKGKPISHWLKQVDDPNRGLQVRAGRALSEAPEEMHEMLIPKLIPLLKAKRENTRPWAALALGAYGPKAKAAIPDLMPMLKGTQYERNRAAAAKALGQILKGAEPCKEVDEVVKEMIRLFKDKYLDVRHEAVKALGMIGMAAKACVPHLVGPMGYAAAGNSTARNVGKDSIWTVGVFGELSKQHIDKMISIMHGSPLPHVIRAIGEVGPVHENVVPNIVDRMEKVASGTVIVREGSRTRHMGGGTITANMMAGFDVLEKWGEKSAPSVDYMMHLISHKKWTRRMDYAKGAVRVLGAIGPKAKKAVPTIEKNCLGSSDEELKKAAEAALAKIKGK
jgi:hypothetical protein